MGFQETEPLTDFRVGVQLINQFGHDFHGFSAALPCVAGCNCGGIQIENTHGMIVGGKGSLVFIHSCQCLL